jgi:CRP-like cAMP-binding protein
MREILSFCSSEKSTIVPDQTIIIEENTKTGAIFILIEGKIEIIKNGAPVAILSEPGTIIGEISLLQDCPHTATCRSLGKVKMYSIMNGKEFLLNNVNIFWLISRDLANKLQLTTSCLASFSSDIQNYSKFELNRQLDFVEEVIGSVSA